jgi:hypothetical protein
VSVRDSPQPSWPAWAHDSRWSWCLEGIEPLATVAREYLERGEHLRVRLIDSDLILYRVADSRVLGRAGILGWRPGFRGTYLRVQPEFAIERKLSLPEAQRYVLDFASSHPQVFEGGAVLDEVTAAVLSAHSPQELFRAAA